jgi:5-methylcytosine-specific restriction protein A
MVCVTVWIRGSRIELVRRVNVSGKEIMPHTPPRICAQCGRPGCTQHQRPAFAHREPPARIRGRQLQRLRQQLFRDAPLCVDCLAHGRVTVATIRDHVVPLTEGGRDDDTNTQALCVECHDQKSQRESERGKQRGASECL